MRRTFSNLPGILVVVALIVGCSRGASSPLAPDTQTGNSVRSEGRTPVLLGLYEIELDGETGVAQVVPLRGPDFQVNVVRFLQPPAGDPANLKLSVNHDGTKWAQGIFDLDISITHPFPGTNLRGFDVRGIVLGESGTQTSWLDSSATYPRRNEARLLNADGYTRWWNAVEFLTPGLFGYTPTKFGFGTPKATINGYKYFADCLGPSDPPAIDIDSRGTFSTQTPSGDPNTLTRQYIIKFPVVGGSPKIRFRYAICASFATPEPGTPPPAPIEAYPLAANCPEAYQISVSVAPASTAWFTSTASGGDLVLDIEIFDWQALENPHGLPGEIGIVRIESPTMWTGTIDPIAIGEPVPTGNPTSSAWRVEIKNVTPDATRQDILVTAQSADPTTYAPPIPGAGVYPGAAVLSAYQLVTLELPDNCPPTIGQISGPLMYAPGVKLKYTLSSMFDVQDGPNLTVKWDFDGDKDFEDDEDGFDTNMTGTYTFAGDGVYYAQCRVFDYQNAYTDSNMLTIEPLSLPYRDPMDISTSNLWSVHNGLFGYHGASLQWNVQDDHWSTKSFSTGEYENSMNTTLVSPALPIGDRDTAILYLSHRYRTEVGYDECWIVCRRNGGGWTTVSPYLSGAGAGYPEYTESIYEITGFSPGDIFELGFAFGSDDSTSGFPGWDITELMVIDNKPPVVEGIYGPESVNELGPSTYSTVATDIDGIASYMWSVERQGFTPAYDDPGDGLGNVSVTFPEDGKYEIRVEVTDMGNPPLSTRFGPLYVTAFSINEDAFFSDHFIEDTGAWTFTGGIADGSYQDWWHIEPASSFLSNVGPDGCYAEEDSQPIEKTAAVEIVFPSSPSETRLKMIHRLGVESDGPEQPYDGQWVTLDGMLIEPSYGFLYQDNNGNWDHGFFVGVTNGWEASTFVLGSAFNDGLSHTLAFHSLSCDTSNNCGDGWQIDYVELWLNE